MSELEPGSELLTRTLLEAMDGKDGRKGTNLIVSFLFLFSSSGPHTGLDRQGQRPKTVEATILPDCSYKEPYKAAVWKYTLPLS
jgi:hypothetical protein